MKSLTKRSDRENMKQNRELKTRRAKGFTLVELMISLLLSFIAMWGLYKTYVSYSTAADTQEQALELQQNLRVSMSRLTKELRPAGLNSREISTAPVPGFVTASSSTIRFRMDLDKDGDVGDDGEDIQYFVAGPDADGLYGLGRMNLNVSGTAVSYINKSFDPPAVGVRPLDFVFLDGSTAGGGVMAFPITGSDLDDIRAVQVTMVLRSVNEDYSYKNTTSYLNLQGTTIVTPRNDHYYRRPAASAVNIRHMGLSD